MNDTVTVGTKIKVVAALMVVGFAGYVANWVQQPTDISTDIFNVPGEQTQAQTQTQTQTQTQVQLDAVLNDFVATSSGSITPIVPAETILAESTPIEPLAPAAITPEQIYQASAEAPAAAHGAAQSLGYPEDQNALSSSSESTGKIASSGPEDFLYLGTFGGILFANRKLLRRKKR